MRTGSGFAGTLMVLALAATGCLPSLQPLIEEQDAHLEPGLVGTWVDEDDGTWRRLGAGETSAEDGFVVEAAGEKAYRATMVGSDGSQTGVFTLRVATFGTGMYLELTPQDAPEGPGEFYGMHFVPASTFYKIELKGDALRCLALDGGWLEGRLESGTVRLPHVTVDGNLVLTATSKQLQRFVERHGSDPGAFVEPGSGVLVGHGHP